MIFFVFTDTGLMTAPIVGATFQEAVANMKAALPATTAATVKVGIILPHLTGQIDTATGTLSMSGDAQVQAALRSQAGDALAANATYLAIGAPTNAQVVAQVRALTQEVNALIKLIVGNFD